MSEYQLHDERERKDKDDDPCCCCCLDVIIVLLGGEPTTSVAPPPGQRQRRRDGLSPSMNDAPMIVLKQEDNTRKLHSNSVYTPNDEADDLLLVPSVQTQTSSPQASRNFPPQQILGNSSSDKSQSSRTIKPLQRPNPSYGMDEL